MTDPVAPEPADDLAAEYALGVLEGEALARAIALERSDPEFARAVADWQRRFAPMLAELAEESPPPSVWRDVDRHVQAAARPDWPRRVRTWQRAAFASGALAASLAAFTLLVPRQPVDRPEPARAAPEPRHVAQLVSADGTPLLAIAYDPGSGTMKAGPATLGETGRVPELWIIPEGGSPYSLGELTTSGSTRILPQGQLQRLVRDGATMAITLEERAGIPHEAPTSEIIATGTLTSI